MKLSGPFFFSFSGGAILFYYTKESTIYDPPLLYLNLLIIDSYQLLITFDILYAILPYMLNLSAVTLSATLSALRNVQ